MLGFSIRYAQTNPVFTIENNYIHAADSVF